MLRQLRRHSGVTFFSITGSLPVYCWHTASVQPRFDAKKNAYKSRWGKKLGAEARPFKPQVLGSSPNALIFITALLLCSYHRMRRFQAIGSRHDCNLAPIVLRANDEQAKTVKRFVVVSPE